LGVAEAIKSIYVRPLNNYEYAFRDSRQRTIESIQQLSVLTREKGLLDDTNQKGQAQLTSKQVERRKLDLDLVQVQKEQAVILAESKRLQAELDALTTSIASSYQKLKDLHSTMVSVQSGGVIPGPNP
jgi:chromosome segregation ATPase